MTTTTLQTFVPSATSTIVVPAGFSIGSVLALPAVDGSNVAARITNNSSCTLWLKLGTGSFMPAGPDRPGSIQIAPGAVAVLPTGAGTATLVGASFGGVAGGSWLFERGTLTTATYYDATTAPMTI